MTLKAAVIARYSNTYLTQLTNPDSQGAVAPDDARLDLAVDDAKREFEMRAAVVFDPDNPDHLYAGVEGVIYYLKKRMGVTGEALEKEQTDFRALIADLALTTGKDRSVIGTSSPLTVDRNPTNRKMTPKFSRQRTRGYRTPPPRS